MARKKNDGRGRMGGRQKGTPNKATSSMRQAIADLWDAYHTSGLFDSDIKSLEPKDRALIMEKFAAYITPKMQAAAIDLNAGDKEKTIEDRLNELAGEEM